MPNEFMQLRKAVRRRDLIRYGSLGLLSVALAACGGKKGEDDDASGAKGRGGGSSRPTVAGAAVQAFVQGAWNLAYSPQGEVNDEYRRIEITGRTWDLDGGDLVGSFTLTGDELQLTIDNMSTDNVWAATGMPGTVGEDASLTLQWGHDAESGLSDGEPVDTTPFPLPVAWDGTTLKIQTVDGVLITAVRA
ncbi:hypothetical protein AB0P41_03900 [Streptomyces sp. NPDC079167]|uniref:hypothetical protein n=1 Tax=Streptomyces sp. NPDC079167 TaxID=3154513 RepID=UPI0034236996